MENKTIRIRTTPGVDKNINVELKQDFDFIEILSLKISQEDVYQSFCANYGVVVGRVIVNKGFGVPNAKVSVFIPISDEDQKNELISSLYPYKSVNTKNSDGIRYNLFLSEVTCDLNPKIGTFPTKKDLLENEIQLEIFEKYYKYTTKTNSAGDYIIFGTPTGQQTLHVDVDLSDTGLLSLRPYELISQGLPKEMFDGSNKFKSSENLDELPQVRSQDKSVDIVPFWGDVEQCNFGITRCDFDLAGFTITPSAVFIGSIFTDTKKNALSKRCNPKNDMGEQCELRTADGTIDVLRVIYNDLENPLGVEIFKPFEGNDLIDEDGTYAFTLPMYYDRLVTDEFGNLVKSSKDGVGIPTKGKYRFKLKFNQPSIINKFTTASLIVPSLHKQHGGSDDTQKQRWVESNDINTDYPDLDLDFHTFEWKQVYTLSQFIKKWRKGGNRFSFLGLKGCDECDYNNYLPFNNAIKKASVRFFLERIFIQSISTILKMLIILANIRICGIFKLEKLNIGIGCTIFMDIKPFEFVETFANGLLTLIDGGDCDQLSGLDTNCGGDGCSCDCGTDFCLRINFNVPTESTCTTLAKLEDWKCCAILDSARDNKAIKFTFYDSWLNGSAYLFQFKSKVKYTNDGPTKSKFCGPGSDNIGGDNYVLGGGILETGIPVNGPRNCSIGDCLVLGPSIDTGDRNPVDGNVIIRIPQNSPGISNGAHDSGEFIYCNWVSSTKIISLGRIEMCDSTYFDIKRCIDANTAHLTDGDNQDCNISDLRLGDGSNPYVVGDNLGTETPYNISDGDLILVGTGGESGFDREETFTKLNETTYEDPKDVLESILSIGGCNFNDLFTTQNSNGEVVNTCHEFELEYQYMVSVSKVCKIHNDVVLTPDNQNPNEDMWSPFTGLGPEGDDNVVGGFLVDEILEKRYSPSNTEPLNSNDYNSHTDDPHKSFKLNMPYFYFGLIPGKTALNKYKKKYLSQ